MTVINGKRGTIWDWKTGKVKPDSSQLKLFAGITFALHPEVEKISTGFLWLAYDRNTIAEFKRSDVPDIWNEFLPRVLRLENAYTKDKWEAKPSGLCRAWCPVGKNLCDFCGG